ncbi:MAG: MBOAT family O-acyltransferase [Coriobacteriia bacterium]|nr:MBOAT family O-acyltransferase [Coriobacteriia bacterium]
MIFSEVGYFIGLAVAALVFRALPMRAKPWWLFATGAVFYWYFSPAFVGILALEVALVYVFAGVAARSLVPRGRGWGLAAGLVVTLGLLAVYKYGPLIVQTVLALPGGPTELPLLTGAPASPTAGGLPGVEDVRVPLAISFFTFEFVHYLVDSRRGTIPRHGVGDFLGFAFFAPTLVAGPIKRFQGFSAQVREARANADDVGVGVTRILIGLAKKVVIADTLTLWIALLATNDAVDFATRGEIAVALVAYSLRIYFDFSGYSDIAIGSARLFGITVPENFARPYFARNIAQFWRRWHMSLMSWIRDYVYIPLGGSRCSLPRQLFNIIAAFAVSGIWHGAEWHFLAWGLYHGVLVAGYRLWTRAVRPRLAGPRDPESESARATSRFRELTGRAFGTAVTFALVTLGWGLFAMPVDRFWLMLQRLTVGGM